MGRGLDVVGLRRKQQREVELVVRRCASFGGELAGQGNARLLDRTSTFGVGAIAFVPRGIPLLHRDDSCTRGNQEKRSQQRNRRARQPDSPAMLSNVLAEELILVASVEWGRDVSHAVTEPRVCQ